MKVKVIYPCVHCKTNRAIYTLTIETTMKNQNMARLLVPCGDLPSPRNFKSEIRQQILSTTSGSDFFVKRETTVKMMSEMKNTTVALL